MDSSPKPQQTLWATVEELNKVLMQIQESANAIQRRVHGAEPKVDNGQSLPPCEHLLDICGRQLSQSRDIFRTLQSVLPDLGESTLPAEPLTGRR